MQLLTTETAALFDHIVRGRGAEAAASADKIRGSFVLAQRLSKAELDALVASLPAQFVTIDISFHDSAGNVAAAARRGDFTIAMRHFGIMTMGCVSCHARFAAERFPGLATP